jgi:hypothetical protein
VGVHFLRVALGRGGPILPLDMDAGDEEFATEGDPADLG